MRIQTSTQYLRPLLHILGEHAFLFTLGLIALAGALSALVFFLSSAAQEQAGVSAQGGAGVTFERGVFEALLNKRKAEEAKVQESALSFPRDIFRP